MTLSVSHLMDGVQAEERAVFAHIVLKVVHQVLD